VGGWDRRGQRGSRDRTVVRSGWRTQVPGWRSAPDIVAQLLLTPLLAGLSIWIGIAISTRSSDVRVAQQLSLLADLPVLLVISLIAFNAIHLTPALAVGLTSVLVIADTLGWRIVSPMFNRERLITGTR
jgi:hypothetical protein